jgi:hypothetical protein
LEAVPDGRVPGSRGVSMRETLFRASLVVILAAPCGSLQAQTGNRVYDAMGLKPQQVLTGSVLTSSVLPGDAKQVVAVVTYLTGKKGEDDAVNVALEVFSTTGDSLSTVYARDLGKENGGYVGEGDLQLVDLDGDGVNEIIVTWDTFREPLIDERRAEVIFYRNDRFETLWSGSMEYDATRAARKVPPERRDRYRREIDVVATLKTQGITLFTHKTMIAVAGERLPQPKAVVETFPLLQPSP